MTDWTQPFPLVGAVFSERMFFVERVAYRAPKKGEYYISGAIPEIYKAPADLSSEYHVVRLTHRARQQHIWVKEEMA